MYMLPLVAVFSYANSKLTHNLCFYLCIMCFLCQTNANRYYASICGHNICICYIKFANTSCNIGRTAASALTVSTTILYMLLLDLTTVILYSTSIFI